MATGMTERLIFGIIIIFVGIRFGVDLIKDGEIGSGIGFIIAGVILGLYI